MTRRSQEQYAIFVVQRNLLEASAYTISIPMMCPPDAGGPPDLISCDRKGEETIR